MITEMTKVFMGCTSMLTTVKISDSVLLYRICTLPIVFQLLCASLKAFLNVYAWTLSSEYSFSKT